MSRVPFYMFRFRLSLRFAPSSWMVVDAVADECPAEVLGHGGTSRSDGRWDAIHWEEVRPAYAGSELKIPIK